MSKIGNFRSPEKQEIDLAKVATPPAAPQAPATPSRSIASAFETSLGKDLAETADITDRAMSYEDMLKDVGLSIEQAHTIQDALLVQDFYSEVVALTPRVNVTFRSRSYLDYTRYLQAIERAQPKYIAERDELTLRYFVAASLAAFGGESFAFPDPKDFDACDVAFQERLDRVLRMPEAVVEHLGQLLNKFDRKLYVALREGAVESF